MGIRRIRTHDAAPCPLCGASGAPLTIVPGRTTRHSPTASRTPNPFPRSWFLWYRCFVPLLRIGPFEVFVQVERNRQKDPIDMGKRLYVGNLSYDTNDDSLRDAFSADGRSVTDIQIMTDRDTGRPRGFAFVEMASDGDAKGAIEALDGAEVDGRNIKVNEARERTPRGGGGGGGGGDRW